MDIQKHHKRNARGLFWLALVVSVVSAAFFLYDYIFRSAGQWSNEHIGYIEIGIMAAFLWILSFIEGNRARSIHPLASEQLSSSLFQLRRMILRSETSIQKEITYFSLDGHAAAMLKETYRSSIHQYLLLLFMLFPPYFPRKFVLQGIDGEVFCTIKRGWGMVATFSFYNKEGHLIGTLKEHWKVIGVKWTFFSKYGEEIGEISADGHYDRVRGQWGDGSFLDMKEDGIPVEAIERFAASGGTLTDIRATEPAYYAIPGLLLLVKNKNA